MKLSLCMIVRDEEQTLARCLSSAAPFADEIIIVDTGSSDSTKQIARTFTEKIYDFVWQDDFSAARNFSFSKATGDYIMWLDADDVVTSENAALIVGLKKQAGFDVAFLQYAAAFCGETPTFVYYRERIFRRSLNLKWAGEVHEAITPVGKIIYSPACVYHKKVKPNAPARNLKIYWNKILRGGKLTLREKFYYGRELFFNGFVTESVAVLNDFLGGDGWIENKIETCRTLRAAYLQMNMLSEADRVLLYSLTLSRPRGQECCAMGDMFERKGDARSAIYWYELALASADDGKGGGFVNYDYCGYIPAIRLCVLYDRLGETKTANDCNERAALFRPDDKYVLYNREYFKKRLKN